MLLTQKRIRKIENNFPKKLLDTVIVPSIILNIHKDKSILKKMGFTDKLEIGETILPAKVGPVTRFNSEGKELIDKNKPKEIMSREIEWCWNQWAGKGNTERVCKNVIITYKRYARIFINPPSVEVTISKKDEDKIWITTPKIKLSENNYERAIIQINLMLELFGSCHILSESLIPSIIPTIKLNWQILPPGKRPWIEQKKLLGPIFDLIKDKRRRPVIDSRLENMNKLGPDFTATGTYGFKGYIVFGFLSKNIYILESILYGNAIYVFNDKWEHLTKRTKAEIINNGLQIERITHNGDRINWESKIKELLK